jgi:hypothetical protein
MINLQYTALSAKTYRPRTYAANDNEVLSKAAKDGYKFGYRHQFDLITINYAKLLKDRHLGESNITPNYAYLS